MLALARDLNESIIINGNIRVTVVRIHAGSVTLGITAPPDVTVHREEVQRLVDKEVQREPKT